MFEFLEPFQAYLELGLWQQIWQWWTQARAIFDLSPLTIVYYCSFKLEIFKNIKKIRKYLKYFWIFEAKSLLIQILCKWCKAHKSKTMFHNMKITFKVSHPPWWALSILRLCFDCIFIFRQDCGGHFGNLFWPQFEWQNTNSFERKIHIETTNIQHVLVLMWTQQFLQNPTFRSSYFSPHQKSYKATQQLSC